MNDFILYYLWLLTIILAIMWGYYLRMKAAKPKRIRKKAPTKTQTQEFYRKLKPNEENIDTEDVGIVHYKSKAEIEEEKKNSSKKEEEAEMAKSLSRIFPYGSQNE